MERVYYRVKFSSKYDLFQFNKWADSCSYNIDVRYNSKVLDGKSLIGLMGMDISNPIIVILYTDNANDFVEKFSNIILDKIVM